MKRTIQTAESLGVRYEQWKSLNEIDAVGGSLPRSPNESYLEFVLGLTSSSSSHLHKGRLRGNDVRGDPGAFPAGVCAKRPRQISLPLPERGGEICSQEQGVWGGGGESSV